MTEKQKERQRKEFDRFQKMWEYEKKYTQSGMKAVAGIDEAGRGPLAGPVVSAAVILDNSFDLYEVNDSKKLSPAKRERLFDGIVKKAVAYAIGIEAPEEIDRINILQATLRSMEKAVQGLKVQPGILLIDGNQPIKSPIPQETIPHGDSLSLSIAAASILAKVTRDHMMLAYDKLYPEYGFAGNKGYGTKAHLDALAEYGSTPIHRQTFLRNLQVAKGNKEGESSYAG